LSQSAVDALPQPTGWRMLVLPYAMKSETKGGIALTRETVDREALATVIAKVVRMGPLCYNDTDKYGTQPWCQAGDYIAIGRYSGARFKIKMEEEDGSESHCEVRIINDDEVIAKINDPDDIVSFA
jgi:co-chaperonin GroES (HSP10)|tara:strand:+ start:550 stop:927 length:378 start_codon:yes stop_codon:yes gene_type:complete